MYRTEVVQAYSAYLPQDRLAQLGGGWQVPERGAGAVLFADVVGFTGLTTRLAELYGPRRGAEEVPVYLNRLYEALSGEVDERGGSVVGFAGDAITCWFPGDDGAVAVECGLAMQAAMAPFARVALAGAARGQTISLALKVSVSAGNVRRFVVGDPGIQLIDVIAGGPVAQIEALESVVQRGQVVVSAAVAEAVKAHVRLLPVEAPPAEGAGAQGARLVALPASAGRSAALRGPSHPAPPEAGAVARWLLPTVQRRLSAGAGEFLTELRPVAALFLSFDGIDLDADPEAPAKFNQVVCAAQQAASDYGGNVLQVSSGDKGNYLYMAFGAPVSHENDVQRCAAAALDLRDALTGLRFLTRVSIGLGYGTARTGAYGSESRRTYGALGEGTNMAARMMGKAGNGQIFVSEAFADALPVAFHLAELPSLLVKGRAEPVRAFELLAGTGPVAPAPQAGLGQLVGREEELAFLRAQLHAAAQGEGRIVQLVADAGMGKSELLKHALAGGGPVEVVRGACQAFGRTAPYRLWKSVFHRLLGLDEGSPASQRVTATYHALGAIDGSLTAQADLLAPVLDLPLRSSRGAAEDAGNALDAEDAEARNSARRTLLLNIFRSAARRAAADGRPLVLFLEDLHWLDPAS